MPDDKYKKLLKLVPEELWIKTKEKKKELLPAEDELLHRVVTGEPLVKLSFNDEVDDPKNADNWNESRTIRAEFLRWLSIDKIVSPLIHARGFTIIGVKIEGDLDFECTTIPHRLGLLECAIQGIILLDASTRLISLSGSHTGPILADRIRVEGGLFLHNGFVAKGEVRLLQATVKGGLVCSKGTFKNKDACALNADSITVEGGIFLNDGFSAEGEVRLWGSMIKGILVCSKGTFNNNGGYALSADRITVDGTLFLDNGFYADGEVRLIGATITGDMSCKNSTFKNNSGYAISADNIKVTGSIFLIDGCSAEGAVRLLGATIKGNLECSNSKFINKKRYALHADRINVKGSIFLNNGFSADGQVRLVGAIINGDLTCGKGTIKNNGGTALCADGIKVGGNIYFNNDFNAEGQIKLLGAKIKGDLACNNGTFNNNGAHTLCADGIKVEGGVLLNNDFNAEGMVRLLGAKIKGDLNCNNGTFETLVAQRMTVNGRFIWRTKRKPLGYIDLQDAKVGQIIDNEKSWPTAGRFEISGFEYKSFSGDSTLARATQRLKWVLLQYKEIVLPLRPSQTEPLQNSHPLKWHIKETKEKLFKPLYSPIFRRIKDQRPHLMYKQYQIKNFNPQPFEQLAKVLRNIGHEEDAREVLLAKQEIYRTTEKLDRLKKIYHWALYHTIEHGWRPSKVLKRCIIPTLIIGTLLFAYADHLGLMVQSKANLFADAEHEYPKFNAIIYSLDTFVPFLNLHQEDYWIPHTTKLSDYIYKGYLWLHIALGWLFSTLAAVALSGIKRKE